MKIEECIDDPQFRVAFVEHEVSGLQEVINGNKNILYHNEGKLSILEQIKKNILLDNEELNVINEHLDAVKFVSSDIKKQNNRLNIMINIYNKFLNKKEVLMCNNLKLV
jgi:hypothetical protein